MASELWTVRRILNWTCGYLEQKGDEHPRLSAEWLLSNATGLSRVELYMNFDRPLDGPELDVMRDGVRRRGAGEPLQYVTGEMPFRHIVLRCEKGVLIPRPETEILVDAALEGVDGAGESSMVRVLEVGTGTGCIACSIAGERKNAIVVATDLSHQAAVLARRNADALSLGGRVDVVECDLVCGVPKELCGTFSVLVSNPPYIPSDVVPMLPVEVQGFEPNLALDGGADGLDVFRRILEVAPRMLAPGGMLCVELFEENVHVAAELTRAQGGWSRVEVREDLTHRPRVLVAVRHEVPDERRAVKALQNNGVVVLPTDSVYGIGCMATPGNPAHEKVFAIKRRPRTQTLPWLIADFEDLHTYGQNVPEWAASLARESWPGALTLVVRASDAVAPEYRAENGTIALRIPDSDLVRGIIREVGPLAMTSANVHGEKAAASGSSLSAELVAQVDCVVDEGPTSIGVASTVVDATGESPRVLRQGTVHI